MLQTHEHANAVVMAMLFHDCNDGIKSITVHMYLSVRLKQWPGLESNPFVLTGPPSHSLLFYKAFSQLARMNGKYAILDIWLDSNVYYATAV